MSLEDMAHDVAHDASLLADCEATGPLREELTRAMRYQADKQRDAEGEEDDTPEMTRYQPGDLIEFTPEAEADIKRRQDIIIHGGKTLGTTRMASAIAVGILRLNESRMCQHLAERQKTSVWDVLQQNRPDLFIGRAGYAPRGDKRHSASQKRAGVKLKKRRV